MLKMDHANVTQAMLDAESPSTEKNNSNEYFYILIVMSFYGIFLIGIMLGYMKSKRKENQGPAQGFVLLCWSKILSLRSVKLYPFTSLKNLDFLLCLSQCR
uniref:KCNE4 protein n=1 Tax=Junco hyemalis TaxID=40217 RepID=A0A8C5JMG1_JUNHY